MQRAKPKTNYRCKLWKKENQLGSGSVGALKKHELSEKHKRNVNNLIVCCNFSSPWNTTLLNSESSLVNHPGETRSHCENNVSVIEKTSLQSAQNQSSILLSFNNKAKREAEMIWSLFCV